ncbi:hypothetical protein BS78_05G075900 [Paspalum vaginatum]|nr:hypothetical protein BS78_05G075900 [Paspalum vaginatum]
MDDVWNHHAWEKVLEPPLINSLARGSRVLVTTRDDTVARGMMAKVPYHYIDKLHPEDAWSLLKMQVVGNGNNAEQMVDTLKSIGMEIIAKCDGLPLAVKVMGGLLRQKKTRRSDWKNVLHDSAWSVSQMPEELNYAVHLSYKYLHPNLKPCFLYYALLPKNTVLWIDDIVDMWISEGFVHGNSRELEVLGKEYYDQLIARNLIEQDKRFVEPKVCNMHDVIRSFAQYVARDEALIAHKCEAGGLTNKLSSQNVIRLSLQTKESESNELRWSSLQAHTSLRTLILFGQIKINPGDSLLALSCLRILHIESGNFDELSESLVQLKHLRYLSIRGTDTSRLPQSIVKMKFLQHINVGSCKHLVKLPCGIGKLQQLRFLGLRNTGINNIPRGFGGLTNLRSLYGFPVHMEGDWCSLEELEHLNQLIHLQVYGLNNVSSSLFAIKARLSEKVCLSSLHLSCTNRSGDGEGEEQQQIQKVFDELCPPPYLENLTIQGYFSQQLPNWMVSTAVHLGSLRNLKMENLPYCTELPDELCHLPILEFLNIIKAPAIKRIGPEFLLPDHREHPCAMENMESKLEIQVIRCSSLERITNLPKLQELRIIWCPKMKELEGLPALQGLLLEDYDMETLPRYLQDVKPRHVRLNCSLSLLTSIAAGKSSPEWGKFNRIQHLKAYANKESWYVLYTRNPFRIETNISQGLL